MTDAIIDDEKRGVFLEAQKRGLLSPEQNGALTEILRRMDTMEIDVGGATLSVPRSASQDEIRARVAKFRQTPEFDAIIDKKRGAPAKVRTLVGSAPQADRLANLQQFYPDAVPHGEDNFVFTDPDTGRPTLYNPDGLDLGDVFSVGRELTQTVFSGVGAVTGGISGAAASVPTGGLAAPVTVPGGAVVGAGIGNALGGATFDAIFDTFHDRIDTRTVPERLADTGIDFVFGAAGQRVGELASAGTKAAFTRSRSFAQEMARKFASLGIDAPAGAVSGSKAVQGIEKALEGTGTGGSFIQKQAEQVVSQTRDAAAKIAQRFGTVQTREGAGGTIKNAVKSVATRFDAKQGELYDKAFDLIGSDTRVAVESVRALRKEMELELSRASRSLKSSMAPAIEMLKQIESDAAQGIPFGALRQVRTEIGKELSRPPLVGSLGIREGSLRRIYGALTEDMSLAAKATGDDAARALEHADRYTRLYMQNAAKLMEKIHNFDADEKAFDFLVRAGSDNARGLAKLRGYFQPEEWDTVAATVLNRLGQARPGAQDAAGEAFSVHTFLTNWNKLSPEAKKVMFGGKRYQDLAPQLDNLVQVIDSLKETEKLVNTSNTAKAMANYLTIAALGGGVTGLAFGGDPTTIASGVGAVLAPRYAAKLITSPQFVNWLTTPVSPNGIGAHIGRLFSIAVAEPETREAIEAYVTVLRSVPVATE